MVVQLARGCRDGPVDELAEPLNGIATRMCDAQLDHALVSRLAEEASKIVCAGPCPSPRGLVAELTSRPGRTVEAWLALDILAAIPEPRGIVVLVRGSGGAALRHSISWLLVHPAARRRGVGRWLAAKACRRACTLGATEVFIECHAAWHHAIAFWRSVGFDVSSR